MSINSRAKGKGGELEFAGIIMEQTGIRLQRNLNQTRNGGYDLIVCPDAEGPVAEYLRRFAIENKRHRTATQAQIKGWWQQAYDQAQGAGKLPCLAYRADRSPWRVVLPMTAISDDLPASHEDLDYTLTMSVHGFGAVLRECA